MNILTGARIISNTSTHVPFSFRRRGAGEEAIKFLT
jgi:hypothetical protein